MDSFRIPAKLRSSGPLETSCGYLLQELKLIWDEVGQDQLERNKVLLQLEQECLEVYRRKVDTASISRAHLHQKLADSEAEFTRLLVSLGERSLPGRPEKMVGTLKEQLDLITPALKEMQQRKEERMNQFREVQMQIKKISAEIAGQSELDISLACVTVDEHDLSLKKLEEYRIDLQRLHKEKNDRLTKVDGYISAIRNLSATLGMDSYIVISEVHPSLDGSYGQHSKNISDNILARLKITMDSLEEEKQKRIEKLHNLGEALINLWNLMETSYEDCIPFSHVAKFVSVAAAEICGPRSLALEIIQKAEAEVERLDRLKASKMKELLLKKQTELKDICKRTHIEIPSQSEMDNLMHLINSGEIGHADLLATVDEQISRANEEASSRKSIMEKVEKWMSSLDEERWLEEYSRDDNRYSVKRGAHKNLKRAEHARITVNKIPALVDSLIARTRSWEEERKNVFLYDKVPLLAMLEEYMLSKEEKEEEMQRQRVSLISLEKEKKKINVQLVVEQENLFRTRPSTSNYRIPNRSINGGVGSATPINRRLSMGIQQLSSNSSNSATQSISFIKRNKQAQDQKMLTRQPRVSHFREDTASVVSATYSAPFSP